jgi:uncharacterized protein (DUF1330 family)
MNRSAYLLVLDTVRDTEAYARHLAALPLLYARAGGRCLASAVTPGVGHCGERSVSTGMVVSYWASMEQLRGFWSSTEHQAIRRSQPASVDSEAMALPGQPLAADATDWSHLVAVLGHPISPAVFEHEGARSIAVARRSELTVLEGKCRFEGCALYGFHDLQLAHRVRALCSSHRRNRALLAPMLTPLQWSQAA